MEKSESSCFNYDIKVCEGACVSEENVEDYNKRVKALIDKNSYENKNMILIDRGRDIEEKSVILIKDGVFQGIGFFDLFRAHLREGETFSSKGVMREVMPSGFCRSIEGKQNYIFLGTR